MPSACSFRLVFPITAALATVSAAAQHEAGDGHGAMQVAPTSDEGQKQIATFELGPDLVCDLVAAEPDVCNIVAFAIDGQGRFYVAETFRIKDGVFDDRSYMQWKDRDLASLTVADRVAVYEEFLPDKVAGYADYSERVRMLVDSDRNGSLDRSTVFAAGFNALADGIASGVLPVGNDVFFTNIPKLWRLRDTDGDGVADERSVVHDGYGVHTSLIGHDLHGLVVGPDRRLYFSIGDRGLHVEHEGQVFDYPHEGAVLRCELDGSGLEVVHRGLRNPQELAFDQWGDLFTGDNNSDGGDKARIVQVIPGADSGWCIGYQWLSDRGSWNRERMWEPRWPGQAAWIVPPIANFANGPSGLAYYPGAGLPERYRDCFFLCEFRGGPSYSGIYAFRLDRSGAGYELVSQTRPVWRTLPTDLAFGPDGALYFSDWVNGWDKTGKGRIYRVRTAAMGNDMALRNTARLLASDLSQRPAAQLRGLLEHDDQRVRQAAQFALVDQNATDLLANVAATTASRLARLHAVWGLGILGRRDPGALEPVAAALSGLLEDGDGEVRAAAARMLGDARHSASRSALVELLADTSSRVRREAALALARLGESARDAKTGDALIAMLRANDDRDAVLRHAAVFALASTGNTAVLRAHAGDASRAVRIGIVLALARLRDPSVANFLADADAAIRFEAARAIQREPITAALPALAALAGDDTPDTVSIDWRALNANRMIGDVESGERLVHAATLASHDARTRTEAIEILAEWPTPHGQDRVFGNWRPCERRNPERVVALFANTVPALLQDRVTAEAAATAAGRLKLTTTAPALAKLVADRGATEGARVAALNALATMEASELGDAVAGIDADAPVPLRKRAIELLSKSAPERAVPILATLLDNASLAEQQAAFTALGDLRHEASTGLLRSWMERLAAGDVPAGARLELLDAAAKHDDPALRQALAVHDRQAEQAGPLGKWQVCLEGGDRGAGRRIFFDNEATRCTRCHTLGGSGGNAGPVLDAIGKQRDRAYLLEALITPSAKIAEGFGSTTVELHNGDIHAGFVTKDSGGALTIVDVDGKATDIAWDRIKAKTPSGTSAMPPMGGPLNRRQIRDLIAFLAAQRKDTGR
ncbi:MAG: HEAT repeat domain-containing protein [Planctomycetes bacterium]|nr:HEAT repeat domain-containing protein [Planctomycetota bacterium]